MNEMFEGTAHEKWLQEKWGRFSASQMLHLLTPGKTGIFSQGGITYIEQVAREAYTLFNNEENGESYAMKRGKMLEPQSYAYLRKLLRFDGLQYFGGDNPVFDLYCPDSGVSPDCKAMLPDGTVSFGAELKNPSGKVHMFYLRNIKDQFDLKKVSEEYYAQVQFTLLKYKCEHWIWSSHNEFFPEKDKMLLIEVKPESQYQNNMAIRLKQAVKEKYKIIEEMMNRPA